MVDLYVPEARFYSRPRSPGTERWRSIWIYPFELRHLADAIESQIDYVRDHTNRGERKLQHLVNRYVALAREELGIDLLSEHKFAPCSSERNLGC